MKIKLFYIQPNNCGNLMMASVFIQNMHNILKIHYDQSVEFYTDVLDDEELYRLKTSLPEGIGVYREKLYDRKRRGLLGKLQKLFFLPVEILFNRNIYDACVVLGGDCISQYYSSQVFISDMIRFWLISKKVPVYLVGQTMGPFSGYGKWLAGRALQRCYIYTRDDDCYRYLKRTFAFKNLYEARDLAFLDLPMQSEVNISDLISKYSLDKPYVSVVISGAYKQYLKDIRRYIEEYNTIIKYIIDHLKFDVLLLVHVAHTQDSNDRLIVNQLVNEVQEPYLSHIHTVTELLKPQEVRALLGGGVFTVTGRMHAAVSSINRGVVPICLSYSVKYKGVIGNDFGLNSCIIQCRGSQFWEGTNVSDSVKELCGFVLNNNIIIKKKISESLEKVKEKVLWQIQDVAEDICKKCGL